MKLILPQPIVHLFERFVPELHTHEIVWFGEDGVPQGDVAAADVYFRWWTPRETFRRTLRDAPSLRWVHTASAGVEHLLQPEILEREDLLLTNSAGAHAIPIAEWVMLYVLAHVKQAFALKALPPADWEKPHDSDLRELTNTTMLIIGIGQIGQEIATRASAFGIRVVGSRRRPRPMPGVAQVVGDDAWRDLLPEADFVVVSAPLTDQTRGMIDAAAFAAMKPDAYLINIARGQIIDTAALLAALDEGRIGGAGLDAFDTEPLPADDPLWQQPNVWVTPHITYSSPRTRERMVQIFADNLRRFQLGETLVNIVDKQAGY